MEKLNVLSIIKLLPESNEQVSKFTTELNNVLDDGEINPLDILLCIKGFEKVVKNVKELLNELAVDECSKYSEKDINYKNAILRVGETGTRYDFSKCNDFEIIDYNIKATELKTKIKARETFLKTINGSIELTNEDTGEVVEVFSPAKTSTTTAKVTLK